MKGVPGTAYECMSTSFGSEDTRNIPYRYKKLCVVRFEADTHAVGSWELNIEIPEQYPLQPPVIHFLTKIVHPNVAFQVSLYFLSILSLPEEILPVRIALTSFLYADRRNLFGPAKRPMECYIHHLCYSRRNTSAVSISRH